MPCHSKNDNFLPGVSENFHHWIDILAPHNQNWFRFWLRHCIPSKKLKKHLKKVLRLFLLHT